MQIHSTPKNSIQQVYGKIILLAFLVHLIFAGVFTALAFMPLVIYNIFSVCFYIVAYCLTKLNRYRTIVTMVHLEICLYVVVSTYFLGWGFGFPLYLIALSSVVYFCPFKNKMIPYLFSLAEIVIFMGLKIYTLNNEPICHYSDFTVSGFYIFNSAATFTLMVYAAFISKLSAVMTQQTLTENNSALQDMVNHDTLTGLLSRNHFLAAYEENRKKNIPITLVLSDIDNFKRVNDTYGHDCGDIILSGIASIMMEQTPDNVLIYRWGGEEFVMMLPNYSDARTKKLVEKVRIAIAAKNFKYHAETLKVTMTFGISDTGESTDLNELIRLADKRLYYGKRCGKNMVITQEMKP